MSRNRPLISAIVALLLTSCKDPVRDPTWDEVGLHLIGTVAWGRAWGYCTGHCDYLNVHAYFGENGWELLDAPQNAPFLGRSPLALDDELFYVAAGSLWRWRREEGWMKPWPELDTEYLRAVHGTSGDNLAAVSGTHVFMFDGQDWVRDGALTVAGRCEEDPSQLGCDCRGEDLCGAGLVCEGNLGSVCCPPYDPDCHSSEFGSLLKDVHVDSEGTVWAGSGAQLYRYAEGSWSGVQRVAERIWVGEEFVYTSCPSFGVRRTRKRRLEPLDQTFWENIGTIAGGVFIEFGSLDIVGIRGVDERVWALGMWAERGEYDIYYSYGTSTMFDPDQGKRVDIETPIIFWSNGLAATSRGTVLSTQFAGAEWVLNEWNNDEWERRTFDDLEVLLAGKDPSGEGEPPDWYSVVPVELKLSPF